MRSKEKILSETPQEVKDLVRAYGDLIIENGRLISELDRLKTEHREHMLLVRKYFNARDVARSTMFIEHDGKTLAEATLREAETEKQIRKELQEFTRKDVEELPFKD